MRNTPAFLTVVVFAVAGCIAVLLPKPAATSGTSQCSLGCVTTYGYDTARENVNPAETILKARTLSTLTATMSPDLNGIVYAQPLYISQINIAGQSNPVNALFVATEENWVYALDGDNLSNPPFWSVDLNNAGETPVPDNLLPDGCINIPPEVGITGTPVIDTGTNLMYLVSKNFDGTNVHQRLNVLNLADGTAAATALDIGSVIGSSFVADNQNQRAGLALASQGSISGGPLVYVAWGSHCDERPYTGMLAAFHLVSGSLQLSAFFNDESSSGTRAGIWMSGVAPAVHASDVYMATGNGSFSAGSQYGQSVIRVHDTNNAIAVTGSYTPNAWNILNHGSGTNCTSPLQMPAPYPPGTTICSSNDFDLGSGGVLLARPVGSGYLPSDANFLVIGAGKEGVFYVLDPSEMSNSGPDITDPCSTGTGGQTIQCMGAIQLPLPCCGDKDYGSRGSPAFWAGSPKFVENVLYVAGSLDSEIRSYQMAAGGGGTFNTAQMFGYAPAPRGSNRLPYPGSSPVITWNSNGGSNLDAILWILDTSGVSGSPAELFAYQAVPSTAGGQFSQKWEDITNGPLPSKFMVPTVINGHVYVGGKKPNSACSPGSCLGQIVSWH